MAEIKHLKAKDPNALLKNFHRWESIYFDVCEHIIDEVYQRYFGPSDPRISKIKRRHETYGELEPRFIWRLLSQCALREKSKFVDLGCGMGTAALFVSLASGGRVYGVEIRSDLKQHLNLVKEEFETRCRMWGLKCGQIEFEIGDFQKSQKALLEIKEADMILASNLLFEAVSGCFLDVLVSIT
jgi:[histone H3]-lysine79 N-trimethyltransferase